MLSQDIKVKVVGGKLFKGISSVKTAKLKWKLNWADSQEK